MWLEDLAPSSIWYFGTPGSKLCWSQLAYAVPDHYFYVIRQGFHHRIFSADVSAITWG